MSVENKKKHFFNWKAITYKTVTVVASLSMVTSSMPVTAIAEELGVSEAAPQTTEQAAEEPAAQTTESTTESTSAQDDTSTASTETASTQQETTISTATQEAAPVTEETTEDTAQDETVEEEPAQEESTTVDLQLVLNNASIVTTSGQVLAQPSTMVTVSAQDAFEFTVTPDNGFVLNRVLLTISGTDYELECDENGKYTIEASDVEQAPVITLETEAEPDAEPADDATPIEDTEADTVDTDNAGTTNEEPAEGTDGTDNADAADDETKDGSEAADTEKTADDEKSDSKSDSKEDKQENADSGNWFTKLFGSLFGNSTSTASVDDGVSAASVDSDSEDDGADELTISGGETVNVGGTFTLTTNGSDVTWSSDNESVATVSDNGTVTGVSRGSATITAACTVSGEKHTASKTVYVQEAGGNTATFNVSLSNADLVYYNWHDTSDAADVTLYPVGSGSLSVGNYTTSSKSGYVIFFVKPHDNYLLTGLGTAGNGDVYIVGSGNYGNIASYPGISTVMAAAKAAGYVGAFGYYRGAGGSISNAGITVNCQSPDMTVSASSSKTSDVAIGDELTFTVTITPKTTGSGKDSVTGVEVNSATINGSPASVSNLTKNSDGTYTGTVTYTATETDVNRGAITLAINVTSSYSGTITSNNGTDLGSTATVTKNASCVCQIAAKKSVTYDFASATAGKSLPNKVWNLLPSDSGTYNVNAPVSAKKMETTEVVIDGEGYWTWKGWDHDSLRMTRSGITFTGTWEFTAFNKVTVKYVDEDGNSLADSVTIPGDHRVGDTVEATANVDIKGYKLTSKSTKSIVVKADDAKNVITFVYAKKAGKVGYDLAAEGASWTGDDSIAGSGLEYYYNYGFTKGDTFTIPTSLPTVDNKAFLGWKDNDGNVYAAGDTVTYSDANDGEYVLTAMWASLNATDGEYTYDGTSHSVDASVDASGQESSISEGAKQYSIDGGATWVDTLSLVDAGTYNVMVKEDVTVGGVDATLSAQAKVEIKKATLDYAFEDTYTYNGEDQTLTAPAEVASATGLVSGETLKLDACITGKDAGEYTNIYSASAPSVVKADGSDSTGNYNITVTGKLTIKKADTLAFTNISEAGYEGAYDGLAHGGTVEVNDAAGTTVQYSTDGGKSWKDTAPTVTDVKDSTTVAVKAVNPNYSNATEKSPLTATYELKVAKKAIAVTASDNRVYNGKDQTLDISVKAGVPAEHVTVDGVVSGETLTLSGASITRKKVGVTSMSNDDLKGGYSWNVAKADGSADTDNYSISVSGSLEITKKGDLTLSADGYDAAYDGAAHAGSVTVSDAEDTTIEYSIDGGSTWNTNAPTITDVTRGDGNTVGGVTVKVRAYNPNYEAADSEHALTAEYSLKVQPLNITVSDSSEVTYNGSEQVLTLGADKATGVLAGEALSLEGAEVKGVDAGDYSDVPEYSWSVAKGDGADSTGNYNIAVSGTLTIKPVTSAVVVKIKGDQQTFTYDGTEKVAEGFEVIEISNDLYAETNVALKSGVAAEVKKTAVGTYAMKLSSDSFKNTNKNFESVTFEVEDGQLVINGKSIVPTADNGMTISDPSNAVYDGDEHKFEPVVKDGDATLTKGTDYTVEYSTEDFTNAGGTITVTIKGEGNYSGTVYKSYEITKRHVTLTSATEEFTYDGKEHGNADVTVDSADGGFVKGEVSDIKATTKVTNVTTGDGVDNEISYTKGDKFKAGNYDITEVEGKLTVKKGAIADYVTLAPTNVSATYDGKAHTAGVATAADSNKNTLTIEYSVDGANWTTDPSTITATNVSDSRDVQIRVSAANYDGYVEGTEKLTVTKREVSLKSSSQEFTYDGDAHTAPTVSVTSGLNFVDGEASNARAIGSVTTVADNGTDAAKNTIEFDTTDKYIEDNYVITKDEGTLSIKAQNLSDARVNSPSDVVYNGSEQKWEPTVTNAKGETLAAGTDYDVAYSTDDLTNVTGDIKVTITGKGNYIGTFERTYKITAKEFTVTTGSATKVFDGQPLLGSSAEGNKIEGLVGDDDITLNVTGSQTAVGGEQGNNTYELQYKSDQMKKNYTKKSETLGTLTVTKQALANDKVNAPESVTYDGNAHEWAPIVTDAQGNTLTEDKDYTVAYSTDDFTNVKGEIKVTITGKGSYSGTVTRTYQITKRSVTLASESKTFTYDGKDHGWNNFTCSDDVFAGQVNDLGCKVTVKKRGASKENTVSYKFKDGFTAENFDINTSFGTLTVEDSKNQITVTTTGGSFTYDGQTHGAAVEVSGLPEGYTVETKTSNATATHVTTSAVEATCDALVIKDAEGNTVDNSSLNIKYVKGSITITKAPLTVTTPSAEKVYDGTALTAEGKLEGLVNGETATFKTTGSQIEQGGSENTYALTWNGTAQQGDYELTATKGKLKVTKQTLIDDSVHVNEQSDVTYDGSAHKFVPVVKDGQGKTLVEGTDYSVKYTAAKGNEVTDFTNVGGTITVTVSGKGNYKGDVVRSYQITPATYSVVTDGATKVYDGEELAKGTYTVSGIVAGETYTLATTGKQKDVGSSDNTYDLNWNGTAKKSNYTHGTDTLGKLVVTAKSIVPGDGSTMVVDAPSDVTYNGKAHKWEPVVKDGDATLVKDTDYTVTYTHGNNFKDAQTVKVSIAGKGNYSGSLEKTYVIKQRVVSLESKGDTFTYDGSSHTLPTVSGWEQSGDTGFVTGEVSDVKAVGSVTDVTAEGVVNSITYAETAGSFNSKNYSISKVEGKLFVVAKSIETGKDVKVTSPKDVTYNGSAQKFAPVVTDGTKTLELGKDYTVTYTDADGNEKADFTNVTGTIKVVVTGMGNYTGSVVGTYEIKAKGYTVTTGSASKAYDGEALLGTVADAAKDNKVTGLVNSTDATFTVTGNQTDVGTSDNTYELAFASDQMKANYVLTGETLGKLTVADSTAEIVVTTTGYDGVYTGTEHKASVSVSTLPAGYTLEKAASSASATDVTDEPVKATADTLVIKNKKGQVVDNGKLNIKYVDGSITVKPVDITVTADSDSRTYNGEALTKDSYTQTGSFVKGEGFEKVTVSGSQTQVGQSDNVITYELKSGTKAKNYNIAKVNGTLTVTDSEVDPGKAISKTHAAGTYGLNDTVSFTITATNIYGTAKTLTIGEIEGATLDKSVFENVEPGKSVTATATYTIGEADILAGTFKNTATVSYSDSDKTYSAEDTVTIADKNAHLTVAKTTTSKPANGSSYALGEKIAYDVKVTNDGNVTVDDVVVNDTLFGATLADGQNASVGELKPGESATVKYEYTVTEADVLAGSVKNSATASGNGAGDTTPTVDPGSTEDETVDPNGSLKVEKTTTSRPADGVAYKLDEVVEYKIVVTNNGNLTLTNIKVNDSNADNFAEQTIDSLEPGATREFSATHTVTEADVKAGKVVNTATAKGTSPDTDKPEVDTDGKKEDATDAAKAALTVTKTAEQNGTGEGGAFKLGEEISYTITVANTGNQTVKNITVSDPKADDFEDQAIDSLKPGKSKTYTVKHKVTQEDILAGTVANVATAKGEDSDGNEVTAKGKDTKTIDALNTTLDVTKIASEPADGEAYKLGEKVTYTITVKNSGNVDYTNVRVADKKTGLSETIDKLAVGETKKFTTTHAIDQSDIVAGVYANTVTAKADAVAKTDGSDTTVTPEGSATETIGKDTDDKKIIEGSADLTVKKTVTSEPANGKAYVLGEKIAYKIVVTNNGNLTAKNFQVVDNNADGFKPVTVSSLDPGKSTDAIVAEHVVTSDDIKAGTVQNEATTSGGTTDDAKVTPNPTPGKTDTDTDALDTTLDVTKTASKPADGKAYKLGETVTYTVTVTNKGNVPYTNVKVEDANTGLSETIASLAVGGSKKFTTTHAIDQADIVAGSYKNTATAAADAIADPKTGEQVTPKGGGSETIGKDSDGKKIDAADPKLKLNKTSDVAKDHLLKEGETVNYTVTVENTGNLDLTNVAVNDELDGAVLAEGESATIDTLAVGATATLHYSYTVTQADVKAGKVVNNVTATADNSSETKTDVTPGEKEDPTEKVAPSLYVNKEVANKGKGSGANGAFKAGDTIEYTINVTNNGNVDATGVVAKDELVGFTSDKFDLKKGAQKTFNVSYTVTEDDMVAGKVANTATATADSVKDPETKKDVTPEGKKTIETDVEKAVSGLKVEKTAAKGSYAAGDKIVYTIKVTNMGNVSVKDVKVEDKLTGLSKTATLAAGKSESFTTEYTVTDDDIAKGSVKNTATAEGADPAGKTVKAEDGTTVDNTIDPENPDKPSLKRTFTVEKPQDVTYDGTSQKQEPVVTYNGATLVKGKDYELEYSEDTTNAGSVTVTVKGKGNYTGNVDTTYTIDKREVELVSSGKVFTYDGTEHTLPSVECDDDVFAAQVETLTATGKVTNAGDKATNAISYTFKNGYNEDNFDVIVEEGTLTVSTQSINPNDKTYLNVAVNYPTGYGYDGKEHKWAPTVTDAKGNTLREGTDYKVTYDTDNFTDVKTIKVTISGMGNYGGTVTRGYYISQRPYSVVTDSASKVYDGTPLTAGGSVQGIVEGETYTLKTTGSQTEVGVSDNDYEIVWEGTAKKSNYRLVSSEYGELEVTAKGIVPTDLNGMKVSDPKNATYDGKAHKWSPKVTDGTKTLEEGVDYTVEYSTDDFVDAGIITVTITGTGNYTGQVVKSYSIDAASLTVTTASDSKVYDGSPLTNDTVTVDGLVEGETVDAHATGTITDPGTVVNGYELAWTGSAKESNYTIVSETLGNLVVRNSEDEIVVTAGSYTGVYDGAEHSVSVEVAGVPEGYTVETAESNAKATNAGTVITSVDKLVIKNKSGEDVTDQLNIVRNTGTIEITPATLTVSTDGGSFKYDGTAHTVVGATVTGLVGNDVATAEGIGSQTEVGESENAYSLTWSEGALPSNYTIIEELGTLTVTKNNSRVVIASASDSKSYDGSALTNGNLASFKGLPDGFTVAISTSGSQTVAGTSANTISGVVIRNADGADVTENFTNVELEAGALEVTPAELEVVTESASKVYDGTALTAGGYVIGLAQGESASVTTSKSQTQAGSTLNDAYELVWAQGTDSANYTVATEQFGTLTVAAKGIAGEGSDITVSTPSDVVYDGHSHKWSPVVTDANGNALVEGTDYTVAYDADDFTNVKTVNVTVTGAGNYSGTVKRSYRITKRPLTITTGSARKAYDGTPLTSSEASVEGLADGDVIMLTATGSQTQVGGSVNTYQVNWRDVDANNYEVTEQLGKLVVVNANGNNGTNGSNGTNGGGTNNAIASSPLNAVADAMAGAYNALTGDNATGTPTEERIYDNENPLGNVEHRSCWIHWYMVLGGLATVVYGMAVALRRAKFTKKLKSQVDDVLGNDDSDKE